MSLERRLLSSLSGPDEISQVWDIGLRAETFEDPFCRHVFTFIIDYWLSSQMKAAPTRYAVEQQCPGFHLEPDVDEETWWLAERMMRRFATNQVQELCRAAATTCADDPVGTLRKLQSDSYQASDTIAPRHNRSDMTDYESRRTRYQHHLETGGGITLGLADLDEHTGGLLPGELAAVGAFSKVGKTMYLLNAAARAVEAGHRPIVFSLEMPVPEIEDRLDALLSGVSYNRLSRRQLTPDELNVLHRCQELLATSGRLHIESPEEGERTVAQLTARARHVGSDYLIIDQLSFMEETVRTQTEKQRQASILKQLKNEIGRGSRGKLPCLMAVQLRRESIDRSSGPQLNDFADAAEVERTCDLLMGLSRTDEERANRVMTLHIMGCRRADVASWRLRWDLIDRTDIDILERITR